MKPPLTPPAFRKLQGVILSEGGQHQTEADFFAACQEPFNELATAIAGEVEADSAGIFFVTGDVSQKRRLVLRGASGRLAKLLAGGCVYKSKEHALLRDKAGPLGVTHQVWHYAVGRKANSNEAMAELGGQGWPGKGSGDKTVYPGNNLYTTFRSILTVPIFAPAPEPREGDVASGDLAGGDPRIVDFEEAWRRRLTEQSSAESNQFLRTHRVIGLLKLENRRPRLEQPKRSLREDMFGNSAKLDKTLFAENGPKFLRALPAGRDRSARADELTAAFDATFSDDEVQLAVLIAMELGRIPAWWAIARAERLARRSPKMKRHASLDHGTLVLTEDEVRRLNIHATDVDDLFRAERVAARAGRHLRYALEMLAARGPTRAMGDRPVDGQRRIAREIRGRTKDFGSLLQKAIRKAGSGQLQQIVEVPLHAILTIPKSDERNSKLEGHVRAFVERSSDNPFKAEMKGTLDLIGEEQAHLVVSGTAEITRSMTSLPNDKVPFVRRLLHEAAFAIDDWAGVRVVSDYQTDLRELLDQFRMTCDALGLRIEAGVADFTQAKSDGYRAIHVTVGYRLGNDPDEKAIKARLATSQYSKGEGTYFPIELQLRTGYQHSWAMKTHSLWYKREADLPWELRRQQRILSDLLASADSLSDLVRTEIRGALDRLRQSGLMTSNLPINLEVQRLLEFIRQRVGRDDYLAFAATVQAAQRIVEAQGLIRYGGASEFDFCVEICRHLVYRWHVYDVRLLALALLRNAWRNGDARNLTACLQEYGVPTATSTAMRSIMEPQKDWFHALIKIFQTYYTSRGQGARGKAWVDRVRAIARHNTNQARDKGLLLEAAILLAGLAETPSEPSNAGRQASFQRKYEVFDLIRRSLPGGSLRREVVTDLELALNDVQTTLDFSREPVALDRKVSW